VWPDTHELVDVELVQLRRLMDTGRPLLDKVRASEPDQTELMALAAVLHSFYGGAENIFKRVALEIDRSVPSGMSSHSGLLDQMTRPTNLRPAVISEDLHERLDAYLDFRHMFRHAYAFDLKWRKMRDLVLHLEETLDRLDAELEAFFGAPSP
jgi:hypothetical protein